MVDITLLAQGLTSFLAPFMPYLVAAGQKVAERAGDATWEQAQKIWAKLRTKVEAKPAAQEAVEDVAAHPDDEDARAAMRQQLKKLLDADLNMANELYTLLTEVPGITQIIGGTGNIVAGRDMVGNANITGGSQTFVQPGWTVQGNVHQAQHDMTITDHTENPKNE